MKEKTQITKTKQVVFRMDDELFSELELIRKHLGVNWSFQVRKFLKDKVVELKPGLEIKI